MERYLIQMAFLLAAAVYAWRRGGWPERAVAAALVAQAAIDRGYHLFVAAPQYRELDLWHMSLDLALLAVTVWLASLQVISALGHVLRVLEVDMPVVVYWTTTAAPSYLQILLLAVGTRLNDRLRPDRLPT